MLFGVDMKIVDDDGKDLPWDGASPSATCWFAARGSCATTTTVGEGDPLVKDAQDKSWFPTGDVATIDSDGYMQITDRSKDVIKSGGEWISSIELENIAVSHPAVRWQPASRSPHRNGTNGRCWWSCKQAERGVTQRRAAGALRGKVAKWQVPDDVAFVDIASARRDRKNAEVTAARAVLASIGCRPHEPRALGSHCSFIMCRVT